MDASNGTIILSTVIWEPSDTTLKRIS